MNPAPMPRSGSATPTRPGEQSSLEIPDPDGYREGDGISPGGSVEDPWVALGAAGTRPAGALISNVRGGKKKRKGVGRTSASGDAAAPVKGGGDPLQVMHPRPVPQLQRNTWISPPSSPIIETEPEATPDSDEVIDTDDSPQTPVGLGSPQVPTPATSHDSAPAAAQEQAGERGAQVARGWLDPPSQHPQPTAHPQNLGSEPGGVAAELTDFDDVPDPGNNSNHHLRPELPPPFPGEEGHRLLESSWATPKSQGPFGGVYAGGPLRATSPPQITDDSFIDSWDMRVYRCDFCRRPYLTRERLFDHISVWHSYPPREIAPYLEPEAKPKAEPASIVVIAQGGDMFIEVPCPPDSPSTSSTDGQVRYQVASQVLWIASRVFCAMFGPESVYKEATELRRSQLLGTPTVVSLDDDSHALEIVLLALHHQIDLLPERVEVEVLVQIAAIVDKYELHQALKLVTDKLFSEAMGTLTDAGNENLLFCCYVFRKDKQFTDLSRHLIRCARWEPGRGLLFAGDRTLCDYMPERIVSKWCSRILPIGYDWLMTQTV